MEVKSLQSYLKEMGITLAEFADIMECSRQHMDRVMKKRCYPSLRLSRDISRTTNGIVKIEPCPHKKKEKAKIAVDELKSM